MVIKLKKWQQVVVEFVSNHDTIVGSEEMMALDEYTRNKLTSIQVSLPKGSGHTTLAGHIAETFPTALIYWDINHLKEIAGGDLKGLHKDTDVISIFELHHAIFGGDRASEQLLKLKQKIVNKKVVVVDMGSKAIESHRNIIDYLFTVSQGVVVILG